MQSDCLNDAVIKLLNHTFEEHESQINETETWFQDKVCSMDDGLDTSLHKNTKIHNNNFEKLPNEIILHIFKSLDKCTLRKCAYVCSRWRNISYDESLWESLNTKHCMTNDKALENILRHNIKYLSLSNSYIYNSIHNTFEAPLPKLLYLNLSYVQTNVKTLNLLLSQCSNLIKLSLENCKVDSVTCKNIGHNTKLKVLNMASTRGLDKNGLKYILALNNLEDFNISNVKDMNDESIQYLITKMIPRVKSLNISGYNEQLADCDFRSMICRCQLLIELDISFNTDIAGDSLDFIFNNLEHLKVLHVNYCTPILCRLSRPDISLLKSSKFIHKLKEFNMDGSEVTEDICDLACELGISTNEKLHSEIALPVLEGQLHNIWEITSVLECSGININSTEIYEYHNTNNILYN